jgi:hypothetical protein
VFAKDIGGVDTLDVWFWEDTEVRGLCGANGNRIPSRDEGGPHRLRVDGMAGRMLHSVVVILDLSYHSAAQATRIQGPAAGYPVYI